MATTNNQTQATKIPDVNVSTVGAEKLAIAFGDGRTLDLDLSKLNDAVRNAAIVHGLKQKLVDAAAIARDTVTGRSATINDKYQAVREVFDRITSPTGTWNKQREAGTGGSGGLLVSALMHLTGKDKSEIATFLAAKSNEEKAALRKNQKVAAIIAEIQAENASGDIDTDALLGGLLGVEVVSAPEPDLSNPEPATDEDFQEAQRQADAEADRRAAKDRRAADRVKEPVAKTAPEQKAAPAKKPSTRKPKAAKAA